MSDVVIAASLIAQGSPGKYEAGDFAQGFASEGAFGTVLGTGYGYGHPNVIAVSELMNLLFVEHLDGSVSMGEALMYAKQEYFAQQGVYGVIDEKVLAITTYYGLPFMRITPTAAPLPDLNLFDLSPDAATGLASASISASPIFQQQSGNTGDFYTVTGGTVSQPGGASYAIDPASPQFTHNQPIVPRFEIDLTRDDGTEARGVMITNAVFQDEPFDPIIATVLTDLSNQVEPAFDAYAFPNTLTNLVNYMAPDGPRQRLVVMPGIVFKQAGQEPVFRRLVSFDLEAFYAPVGDPDVTHPTMVRAEAEIVGTTAEFSIDAFDDMGVGRVRVLWRVAGETGPMLPNELTFDAVSGLWKGSAQIPTGVTITPDTELEFFVSIIDDSGNDTEALFKALLYTGEVAIAPPVNTEFSLQTQETPIAGDWFSGDVTVEIVDISGLGFLVEINDDEDDFDYTTPFVMSAEGTTKVHAIRDDGVENTIFVNIDTTAPTVVFDIPVDGAEFEFDELVIAQYHCPDGLGSGAATCDGIASSLPTAVPSGTALPTDEEGTHTLTVTGTDLVGNQVVDSIMYTVLPEPAVTEVWLAEEISLRTSWQTFTFPREFTLPPSVILGPPGIAGGDPITARLRNVTTTGFEARAEEWPYQDGGHPNETVSYLAVEPGRHVLSDGTEIEAGVVSGVMHSPDSPVAFASGFPEIPLVFSQVGSTNEAAAVVTRHPSIDANGFTVRVKEQEAGGSHLGEDVHWVAWMLGGDPAGLDGQIWETQVKTAPSVWRTVNFTHPYGKACVITTVDSYAGGDTINVRHRRLTADKVEVMLDEEQSANAEINHTNEQIAVFIAECDTPPVASLKIVAESDPGGGAGFLFDGDFPAFSLDDDDFTTFTGLVAGTYSVAVEPQQAEHVLTDIMCDVPATTDPGFGTLDVPLAGQDATCTFTFGKLPSLTIDVATVPTGGSGFVFGGELPFPAPLDDGGAKTFPDLDADSYTVTADTIPSPFVFGGVSCTGATGVVDIASGVDIELALGDVATCTFTFAEPGAAPAFEVGSTLANQAWKTVVITDSFTDPIVVAGPWSLFGGDPSTVRIRNLTPTSFQIRLQEYDYLDGGHSLEEISYLIVERGNHVLASGGVIEAGSVSSVMSSPSSAFTFAGSFGGTPILLATLASFNNSQAAVVRISGLSASGATLRLQEQESLGFHPAETVNYVAWTPGSDDGTLDGTAWESLSGSVNHNFSTFSFASSYPTACVLADMQSIAGGDTANLRHRNLGSSSVQIQVDEEQSANGETAHVHEPVGVLVFEC